jgi:endonuclease/exonuclease/phosphatase family metal-dependent hydrolase
VEVTRLRIRVRRFALSDAKLFLSSLLVLSLFTVANAQKNGPQLLTYEELVQLYEQATPNQELQTKLNTMLTTPFVSNSASDRGVKPLKPGSNALGQFLRVAFWNIERGLEYESVSRALGAPPSFASLLTKTKQAHSSAERIRIMREVSLLNEADVIVLNEVDWGMKRTDYRNVVADLAQSLRMNYAFGVEFVEVDPIALGIEKFDDVEATDKPALLESIKVDRSQYRGLHGTAILSRYRLENVRLVPLKFQPHDWFDGEKKSVAPVEKGKRKLAEQVFLEKIYREVRRGGRMILLADIVDPSIPKGRMTIVATHLEDRTQPKNREKQLEEVLEIIKPIENPVVLAGDMNTSPEDGTPTSFKREIKKRLGSKSFWIQRGLTYATGFGVFKDIVIGGITYTRNQADPTVRHVPLVAPNPTAGFFDELKKFRFADGGAFDFRGEANRSIGGSTETLGNSNERGSKGFVTTFEVERKFGFVGKYKLDWIFVKPPSVTKPNGNSEPHLFAPHFGRTLKALNYSLEDRISDHSPIVVDLPFGEPNLGKAPPQ